MQEGCSQTFYALQICWTESKLINQPIGKCRPLIKACQQCMITNILINCIEFRNALKSVKNLASQSSEASWLQSNSMQCHRLELYSNYWFVKHWMRAGPIQLGHLTRCFSSFLLFSQLIIFNESILKYNRLSMKVFIDEFMNLMNFKITF